MIFEFQSSKRAFLQRLFAKSSAYYEEQGRRECSFYDDKALCPQGTLLDTLKMEAAHAVALRMCRFSRL